MTKNSKSENGMMTFGGHLEVLRQTIFRIAAVVLSIAVLVFVFKRQTFEILLGPSEWDFCTYRWIQELIRTVRPGFSFEEFHVSMIATDLSSQFMTHLTTALYLGFLGASPYVVYELFSFVSPALYGNERRYSVRVVTVVYLLFLLGVLMSYYVLFPVSFRFLGTYNVDPRVVSNITLDSYISTFVTLTLMMGLVFQLPVLSWLLGRLGIVTADMLRHYRRHALIAIMLVAAIITPPDLMTLILVTFPLYLLYEVSILVLALTRRR